MYVAALIVVKILTTHPGRYYKNLYHCTASVFLRSGGALVLHSHMVIDCFSIAIERSEKCSHNKKNVALSYYRTTTNIFKLTSMFLVRLEQVTSCMKDSDVRLMQLWMISCIFSSCHQGTLIHGLPRFH